MNYSTRGRERSDIDAAHGAESGSEAANPDAPGRGLAQMDAAGATADRDGHGLVILALMNAQMSARADLKAFHELEKLWVLLEYPQNFVGRADFGVRQPHRSKFPAQLRHSTEERDAVRAADVAAKAFQQKLGDFRRDAVFQTLGFFGGARPFDADDFGEKFFGEPVTQDEMLRDSLPFFRERDAAI